MGFKISPPVLQTARCLVKRHCDIAFLALSDIVDLASARSFLPHSFSRVEAPA